MKNMTNHKHNKLINLPGHKKKINQAMIHRFWLCVVDYKGWSDIIDQTPCSLQSTSVNLINQKNLRFLWKFQLERNFNKRFHNFREEINFSYLMFIVVFSSSFCFHSLSQVLEGNNNLDNTIESKVILSCNDDRIRMQFSMNQQTGFFVCLLRNWE